MARSRASPHAGPGSRGGHAWRTRPHNWSRLGGSGRVSPLCLIGAPASDRRLTSGTDRFAIRARNGVWSPLRRSNPRQPRSSLQQDNNYTRDANIAAFAATLLRKNSLMALGIRSHSSCGIDQGSERQESGDRDVSRCRSIVRGRRQYSS